MNNNKVGNSLVIVLFTLTCLSSPHTFFCSPQKYRQISYDHNLHHTELIEASNREPVIKTIEERELEKSQQIELVKTQQFERSLIIAPILRDYINEVKRAEIETEDYRVFWQKEEQTLYLYKKPYAEPRLKIEFENQKFKPIELASTGENQPRLTNADVSYWQQLAVRLHQGIEKRKRQRASQQKVKKRGRRR